MATAVDIRWETRLAGAVRLDEPPLPGSGWYRQMSGERFNAPAGRPGPDRRLR